MSTGHTDEGLTAYSRQFRIPTGEVHTRLTSILGSEMADDCIEATGAAWRDGPLSWRERSIVTISCMIAFGAVDDRLASHLKWGLDNGLGPKDIEDLIRMSAGYVGYPRATVAMEIFQNIMQNRVPGNTRANTQVAISPSAEDHAEEIK